MSVNVWDSPIQEVRSEAALTLAATAQYVAVQPGFREVKLYVAAAWKFALGPKLVHVLYYDATDSSYTEYVNNVIDKVSTTHLPLDAMATTDYVYLGFSDPVLGWYETIDSTNKNAEDATRDVEYCSTALTDSASLAWTDVAADSDGTTASSHTATQSGAYTFTLPTVKRSFLGTWANKLFTKCYWYRWCPSATLSATIDVQEIIPIYKLVVGSYGWMENAIEYNVQLDLAHVGSLCVATIAATPTLNITWIK